MRSSWGFVLFLIVFLLLYGAMNGYVLFRLAGMLGFKKKLVVLILTVLLTASFILATMLEAGIGNIFSRVIYLLCASWMGLLLILLLFLLIYEVFRFLVPLSPRFCSIFIIAISVLIAVYGVINGRRLEVNEVFIECPVELKAVQISDVHLGSISKSDFDKITTRTNSLDPDVVFITGDLMDNFNVSTCEAVGLVNKLTSPVFFVTGNHEGYVGYERVMSLLQGTKVRLLRNEVVDFQGIDIIGVDDSFDRANLKVKLSDYENDGSRFSILIYHRPEGLNFVSSKNINLMLSGHTHNGQIFPFNFVVRIFYKYVQGLYRVGDTWLYVSVGSGSWGPPMRLGSRREITLLRLGPKDSRINSVQ